MAEKNKVSEHHYVYMLRCADGSFYTGWTTDIRKRLETHNSGRGAKYTRSRLPATLIYYEEFSDKSSALKRECEMKALSRKAKEALVQQERECP